MLLLIHYSVTCHSWVCENAPEESKMQNLPSQIPLSAPEVFKIQEWHITFSGTSECTRSNLRESKISRAACHIFRYMRGSIRSNLYMRESKMPRFSGVACYSQVLYLRMHQKQYAYTTAPFTLIKLHTPPPPPPPPKSFPR